VLVVLFVFAGELLKLSLLGETWLKLMLLLAVLLSDLGDEESRGGDGSGEDEEAVVGSSFVFE
jgi:hypothetical protein